MTDSETRSYAIPVEYRSSVLAALERINRKAEKLGFARYVVSTSPAYRGKIDAVVGEGRDTRVEKVDRLLMTVTISGLPCLHVAGWTVIAKLEATGEGNRIARFDASESETLPPLPSEFRQRCACDHCNIRRRRLVTYVLRNEAGELRQVGTTCLEDFLGVSPDALLGALTVIEAVRNTAEDYESSGIGKPCFDLKHFLCKTIAAIDEYGFVSAKRARESDLMSTATMVLTQPVPGWYDHATAPAQAYEIIAWAKDLDPTDTDENEYLWNLHLIACENYVSHATAGLAASMVNAYRRTTGKQSERLISEHQGTVGDKDHCARVTLKAVTGLSSTYGWTTILIFKSEHGHAYVWKTSNAPNHPETGAEIAVGNSFILCGTIKEHSEYKGTKQTVMTRCSFMTEVQYQNFLAELAEKAEKAKNKKPRAKREFKDVRPSTDELTKALLVFADYHYGKLEQLAKNHGATQWDDLYDRVRYYQSALMEEGFLLKGGKPSAKGMRTIESLKSGTTTQADE